mmetsp:Transcript_70823/g.188295  ORF Transcript_70823/g.188295 Transcript_70823/m.188295 type:complete len:222 (-) Transcript_70823:56-721(-)
MLPVGPPSFRARAGVRRGGHGHELADLIQQSVHLCLPRAEVVVLYRPHLGRPPLARPLRRRPQVLVEADPSAGALDAGREGGARGHLLWSAPLPKVVLAQDTGSLLCVLRLRRRRPAALRAVERLGVHGLRVGDLWTQACILHRRGKRPRLPEPGVAEPRGGGGRGPQRRPRWRLLLLGHLRGSKRRCRARRRRLRQRAPPTEARRLLHALGHRLGRDLAA